MPGRQVSWLPQAALDRMHSDLQAHGEITRAQLADRVVEDAAPLAAYELVSLMTTSEDDNIRLNAAKYLLDRTNGKPNTRVQLNVTETNPVMQILDGVVVDRPTTPPDYAQNATVLDMTAEDEENPHVRGL